MTDETARGENWVVEALPAEPAPRWFGFVAPRLKVPEAEPHADLFLQERLADGTRDLRRIATHDGNPVTAAGTDAVLIRVHTAGLPLTLPFVAVTKDAAGHAADLCLTGQWCVADAGTFLRRFGADWLSAGARVPRQVVESWMVNHIRHVVLDEVGRFSYEDHCHRHALPLPWWQGHVNEWLADCGVTVQVAEVRWESLGARAAEADRRRQEDLARLEAERGRQREAERREAAAQAAYEDEKARLEADRQMSDAERRHRLQMLELGRVRKRIEAETAIEEARRAAERAARGHETVMADPGGRAESPSRLEEAERRHAQVCERLDKALETLANLAALPGQMIQNLGRPDGRAAFQSRERLVGELGFTPHEIAALGYSMTPQLIVQQFRDKGAADGQPIVIEKQEMRSRDIGTARIKALPVDTSLEFTFRTRRGGFVTMLNVGTSGAICLHVPNAYVAPGDARAEAGRGYSVPGPELLPHDCLLRYGLDYCEKGPPGWEHIAVIVSDQPLADAKVLDRGRDDAPLVELTPQEVLGLCRRLSEAKPESWSSAVLSFRVE